MHTATRLLTAASFFLGVVAAPQLGRAQSASPPAVTGKVTSAEEGAMEGVVVSAKTGIVTISVVTNDKGEFSFPASKLGPGAYALAIKAGGYDLSGPSTLTVAADKAQQLELKLVKAKDLSAQLSNQEWIASAPGSADDKRLLSRCVNCHGLDRVVNSKYNATDFEQVIRRMATYSNNSFFLKPQIRRAERDMDRFVPDFQKAAAYLATVNRSATGELTYPLKTLPRVKGDGTRVVITEYDLPRKDSQPHDVIVDADGIAWYSDFSDQFLGRLDPKTLQIKEIPIPLHRAGWPTGALDLEEDPQGNLWLALMFQAGVAKFDKSTGKVQTFNLPAGVLKDDSQQAMVAPHNWNVDGRVWMTDPSLPGIYRIDVASGKTEMWKPYENLKGPHSVYGIYADPGNNLWFLDFGGENIGRVDAKSGTVELHQTPTPRSRPRRGRFDGQGRLWFSMFNQDSVGVYDTKIGKFTEWKVPSRDFSPYDVTLDKTGNLWIGGMNANRILRMNTATGAFTEYPLPRSTNVRRVFVDNRTTPPTFWVGNNHGAAVIKLETIE